MAETSIEWVKNPDGSQGRTWNPIRGCTRVSPGCGGPGPHGGCYAEGIAARFSGPGQPFEGIAEMRGGKGRWTGKLAFVEAKLIEPLRVRKPTTWFVNSMSDLFHEAVPDAWIDRVFAVIALCPQHTFQCLTKRSARMRAYLSRTAGDGRVDVRNHLAWDVVPRVMNQFSPQWRGEAPEGPWRSRAIQAGTIWPLPNVWLGVSAEDQRRADERIPDLLATPAAVRFVSAEPLLRPIDFRAGWLTGHDDGPCPRSDPGCDGDEGDCHDTCERQPRLDWIIVGGESGPNARPMHPAWARSIRDQSAEAGVAYLFKQWGAWAPARDAANVERSEGQGSHGAILEGDTWSIFERGDRHGDVFRVGKKAAGRLLDGRTWDEMPEVRT